MIHSDEDHTVKLTIRLSPRLIAALERKAASEERSPSAEVRLLVKRHLEPELQKAA
jgi:hypothetical protein